MASHANTPSPSVLRAWDDQWDLLPVAIWKLSSSGTVLRANRACAGLLRCHAEEFVGRSIDEFLVDPVDFNSLKNLAAATSRIVAREACFRSIDGSTRHVLIDAAEDMEDGGGFYCVASDHSIRKGTDGHAREQIEFLLRNEEAIIIQNLEGQVIYWSMGAERLYGLPSHEILGRPLPRELADDPAILQQALHSTLERGEWSGEMSCTTAMGTRFEVESRWVLLRDQSGKPQSILLINEDAAESRLLEEERLRAQRQECIGTLAGGIAHDLNNILQPISIAIDLFRARLVDGESEEILGMVDSNLRRATELVRQILTFTSGVHTERQPVEISHLFKDVANFIRQAFPKTIRFDVSVPEKIERILADRTQMEQVLLNLCLNARDAMLEGGTLRLEAEEFLVDEAFAIRQPLAKPGRHVRLSVSDTGRGIPRQIRKKIFEPFFTTKGPEKGTGLGLATALGIIRNHGGFLTLETEEGRGSSFHVFIPVATPRVDNRENGLSNPNVTTDPGHGETILLVDDEATVLKVMQRSLEKSGYRVLPASDGEAGLEEFRAHLDEIRLVITDMSMPKMDGMQLVEEIRKTGSNVPVICTSGLSASTGQESPATCGKVKILPKPCSSATILRAIREALHEKQS
ncbi:MAG: ATP-binding protein [Verrucomicrobiota bacterium]